ncbi:MAG: GMP synthase (glutamine-hydrolyzing), partial [Candidatus Bathyarchaeota archaeon]|nr:GMP synthase (glutamine-hydrolyzing) [Candidatus Bathyarchaeota archaeon]
MSPDLIPDGIVILDFGGQYCHLIARRIREMKVYTEILPSEVSVDEVRELSKTMRVRGVILSGSPSSVIAQNSLRLDERILELGVPVLGLCYGHQLLALMKKGDVRKGDFKE